jgi:hypothetical protein
MVAAETRGPNHARLFFQNPYPPRAVVNSARIVALQVDELQITQVGEGDEGVDEEEDALSKLRYALSDATSISWISRLLHPDD